MSFLAPMNLRIFRANERTPRIELHSRYIAPTSVGSDAGTD